MEELAEYLAARLREAGLESVSAGWGGDVVDAWGVARTRTGVAEAGASLGLGEVVEASARVTFSGRWFKYTAVYLDYHTGPYSAADAAAEAVRRGLDVLRALEDAYRGAPGVEEASFTYSPLDGVLDVHLVARRPLRLGGARVRTLRGRYVVDASLPTEEAYRALAQLSRRARREENKL